MLPKIFTFKNGLKVILIDTKAFPTMTVILLFGAGSRYENKQNNGIAHFLEHMVFKGSKKFPDFFTISSVLEGLGATHNAFTGKDHTGFWVKAPTEHFDKVIEVVADILQNPLLRSKEIEREKNVIVQEMNMYEDQPMRKVGDYFEQLLYPGVALGMDIIGKKETVTKFQRTNFVDYMRRYYRPKKAVLVVAGGLSATGPAPTFPPTSAHFGNTTQVGSLKDNVVNSYKLGWRPLRTLRAVGSPSSRGTRRISNITSTRGENFDSSYKYFLKIIEGKFAKWQAVHPAGGQARFLPVSEKQNSPEALIHYKKTEQTHFSLGFRAFSFKNSRRYALAVLATILGGGASSRLFIEVREKRGLCYYIHTGREHYRDVGYMTTNAGVTNDLETVKKAIETILKEHKKIARGEVEKEELVRAKEIIKGRILLSMEDSSNVASWFGIKQILEEKIESVEEVIDKIQKVSRDEVVELAKQIFRPERLNLALVGPFKEEDFHGFLADYRGY